MELNRDGQLHQLLKIRFPELSRKQLFHLAHVDGLPVSAKWILREYAYSKGENIMTANMPINQIGLEKTIIVVQSQLYVRVVGIIPLQIRLC